MKRTLVLVLLLFIPLLRTFAQNPSPCKSSPEYRQFDFWVGEWDVYRPNGELAGMNSIQLIEGDCVIFENYTGKSGYSGRSFNIYNSSTGKWQQFWVDNQGGVLEFEGEYKDRELRFVGKSTGPKKESIQHKLTFFNREDGKVRQLWEQSTDAGKIWKTVFDGLYVKRP